MDAILKAVMGFYGLGFLVFVVLLVYVISKRKKSKKQEDFERRDN